MGNIDKVLAVIAKHAQGLDDDEISQKTRIAPRQQVQQLCSRLAAQGRIDRRSEDKDGKRRKIHNFPIPRSGGCDTPGPRGTKQWERRLAKLEAATALDPDEILDRALADYATKLLQDDLGT